MKQYLIVFSKHVLYFNPTECINVQGMLNLYIVDLKHRSTSSETAVQCEGQEIVHNLEDMTLLFLIAEVNNRGTMLDKIIHLTYCIEKQ